MFWIALIAAWAFLAWCLSLALGRLFRAASSEHERMERIHAATVRQYLNATDEPSQTAERAWMTSQFN